LRARVQLELPGSWQAQGVFVLWNTDSEGTDPQTYLRDASGNPVFDGKVSFNGLTYTAGSGLGLSLGDKREYLAGLKLAGSLAGWNLATNLSHYWIDRQKTWTSTTRTSGIANGVGTFTRQGKTGWWTMDTTVDQSFGAHTIGAGVNLNRYETDQTSFDTSNWRAVTNPLFKAQTSGKTRLDGVFIEDAWSPSDSLTLTFGARYDSWEASNGRVGRLVSGSPVIQAYATRKDDAVSPKFSAQWELAPGWNAQFSLATATRFPTVAELFQGRLDAAGNFDANSFDPNLKAERSRDANLILRHQFDHLKLTGSVFYQEVDDAIFQVNGFNQFGLLTNSFKNIDKVRQYGAELIGEWTDLAVEGLDLDANLAWIDAQTVENRSAPETEGVQFPRIPKWRINANLRYAIRPGLKLSLGMRYASRPNTDLAGTQRGDTYGYTSELLVLDTRVSWDITDEVQISAGIDNLNNDKAWVFHPYPQRTALIELKWKH